ncbi:hypothetical protein D2E33_08300 [Mycobacteroides abscessus]|nr:hypothetical protein D2E33_08300 [Mycobacteroides abscessus]RIT66069.1 hypothetical protein D2E87_19420 [Mycobacteroides abscessus]
MNASLRSTSAPHVGHGIEVDDEEVELRRAMRCLLPCKKSRTIRIVARATDNLGRTGPLSGAPPWRTRTVRRYRQRLSQSATRPLRGTPSTTPAQREPVATVPAR